MLLDLTSPSTFKSIPTAFIMANEVQPVTSNHSEAASEDAKPDYHTGSFENDVGYKEYLESRDLVVSAKESRWVRTKIDMVILPIFLFTQMLQTLDKTALNYANLFHYQEDLGLHGSQFNYLSAMIYAGYFFGQYPCGYLIGHFKAQKVLAIACFLWGVMVLVLTQCKSYGSALAVRFIMGEREQ